MYRLGPDSGERWQQSYLLLIEGICLFLLGDLGASAGAFRTALAMKHEIADTMGIGYALLRQSLLALHDAAQREAQQRGLEDVHAWLPPRIAKTFGRRIERLGWRRDDEWTPYCNRFS